MGGRGCQLRKTDPWVAAAANRGMRAALTEEGTGFFRPKAYTGDTCTAEGKSEYYGTVSEPDLKRNGIRLCGGGL
jgi:hypothetical protein